MKGTPVIYLGKRIDKAKFRTNIYDANGKKKLVESWAEFEAAMQSGIWFATRSEAMESMEMAKELDQSEGDATPMPKSKPKSKSKAKSKPKLVKVEEVEEESEIPADELDDMVYEVTDANK